MEGRPEPILEEFHVADADRDAIDALIKRVTAALEDADTSRRSIILAAPCPTEYALHGRAVSAKNQWIRKGRRNDGRCRETCSWTIRRP